MEMNVTLGNIGDVLTEPAPSPSAPGNPALEAARAELKDIAINPENPRHAGYQRGDAQVSAYLDELYKQAFPETPAQAAPTVPALRREPEQDNTLTPEDRVAQTEVETMLRQTLGSDYESEMRDMQIGAQHLFSIPNGEKVLAEFSELITALGPLAQVRGIRFLAEIGSLIKHHQGG